MPFLPLAGARRVATHAHRPILHRHSLGKSLYYTVRVHSLDCFQHPRKKMLIMTHMNDKFYKVSVMYNGAYRFTTISNREREKNT